MKIVLEEYTLGLRLILSDKHEFIENSFRIFRTRNGLPKLTLHVESLHDSASNQTQEINFSQVKRMIYVQTRSNSAYVQDTMCQFADSNPIDQNTRSLGSVHSSGLQIPFTIKESSLGTYLNLSFR